MKPRNFYAVSDALADFLGEDPIERLSPITTPIYGFSEATLKAAAEYAREYPELACEPFDGAKHEA
jgi:hypothetical protein